MDKMSTSFPFPSSPHCAPKTTVTFAAGPSAFLSGVPGPLAEDDMVKEMEILQVPNLLRANLLIHIRHVFITW